MDANGTKFHLLRTRADWSRVTETETVHWNNERSELTLKPALFQFTPSAKDRPPTFTDRRGAARDRFGNWYWIGKDESEILVLSAGSKETTHFWASADDGEPATASADAGEFLSVTSSAPATVQMRGMAVTDDHYLVVGTVAPGGLLVFDLYSGGPPVRRVWPESPAFAPFDMAPMPGGGVWVLERVTAGDAKYWAFDRFFNVISGARPADVPEDAEEVFRATTATTPRTVETTMIPSGVSLPPSIDAIAIESLSDGTLLVLDRNEAANFSQIYHFDRGGELGDPVSLKGIQDLIEESKKTAFKLVAHDFAVVDGRIFVVGTDGNQAFAFRLSVDNGQLEIEPIEEFFPMRLFGGKGIVSGGRRAYYDFDDRWIPVVEQHRPRYAGESTFFTPVFDGKDPQCVWHRLLLDACIPSDTTVTIRTRAADSESDLASTSWVAEPALYLRANGSELPYVAGTMSADGSGTWELLFQNPVGRFLQLEITMAGNERTTPHLRALRAYYPRFSYLERYLPSVYREDAKSAHFVERFLGNVEGTLTSLEDKIAAVQMLFDVRSAPAEALDWLASWFGIALDPVWDERRRRLFIEHAMEFFQYRGTIHGLQAALSLALTECVDESIFRNPPPADALPPSIRIVEKFRNRKTPGVRFSPSAQKGPRWSTAAETWDPPRGREELSRLYGDSLGLDSVTEFPLLPPSEGKRPWEQFSAALLGFVPSTSQAERARWSPFLQARYLEIAKLNAAYGTEWANFNAVPFPSDLPSAGAALSDWSSFAGRDLSSSNVTRKRWQAFLSRRYRTIARLNASYRTQWSSFDVVPFPDVLPADGAPILDWFQFESVVVPMHVAAHRFTVMLPVAKADRFNRQKQLDQLALAYRILDIEKPAHTVCDVRFYWSMFRIGEVRLGDGIPIDMGSRSPDLLPPMVLGSGFLADSYLAPRPPEDARDRRILGRDALVK